MPQPVLQLLAVSVLFIACDGESGPLVSNTAACLTRDNNDSGVVERGSALWLKPFIDKLEITGVAADAEGNTLVARSGAQTQKLDPNGDVLWSKSFGLLVVTDRDGDAYVAGTLVGTLELGTTVLSSKGGTDVYVVKFDSSGHLLYGITLGGDNNAELLSLAVDSHANVVVSGNGLGTIKLDQNGNVQWAKSFYGRIALDSVGDTLLTGALTGSVDFGGGALSSRGGADVFVAKIGPTGKHLFSHRFGDEAPLQRGQAIAVDRRDNIIVGGVFEGAVDFGDGTLALPTCPEEVWCKTGGFVTKFDPHGRLLWSLPLGPMRVLQGVAADSHDNIVFSGALPGGVPPYSIPVIAELDSKGTQLWRRAEWPETGIGAGHFVALDSCDNVVWSLSVLPSIGSPLQPYVAKLLP